MDLHNIAAEAERKRGPALRQKDKGLMIMSEKKIISRTLADLPIGQEAVIKTVGGEGNLRCRFLDMGLIPRTKVKIMKVAPMGDPIQIHLRGYDMTIRKEDAAMIELED